MTRPVGFVGLGSIGKPMATRLLAWPGGLHVHDVVPEPVAELQEAGARAASGVAELAHDVSLLCVMVRDDDQVRQVLDEVLAAQPADLTVAVHSTVAPATPHHLAEMAAGSGVRVVDAPVSGGAAAAAAGSLAIMVGGEEEAVEACREPFALMAATVVHAGGIGDGTRMKLARNLIHFVSFTAVGEAQRLAEAAGLDLLALGEVVRHTDAITGGPGAIMHRATAAPPAPDDFWHPVLDHVRVLGEKDLGFVVELAGTLGVDVPLARQALDRLGPSLGLAKEQ